MIYENSHCVSKVNDMEVSGMSQEQVVAMLRSVPTNNSVSLVVSRHGPSTNDDQSLPVTLPVISEPVKMVCTHFLILL